MSNEVMVKLTLSTKDLQLFLRGAVTFTQSIPSLALAFGILNLAIINIYRRQGNAQGLRPSPAVAEKFRGLSREAAVLKSLFDIVEDQARPLQDTAEAMIDEGNTHMALAAINDLNCCCLATIEKMSKLTTDLENILEKSKNQVRMELDSLNLPEAVEGWKKAYHDWNRRTDRRIWVEELAEARPAQVAEREATQEKFSTENEAADDMEEFWE